MFSKRQLFHALAALLLTFLCTESLAELAAADNALNNLYDNLLEQREFPGPMGLRNQPIVERKAQRSTPSLRMRFGRSYPMAGIGGGFEKRWFGDVNQKPIRSPSLRLRFGRRSDPSIPRQSNFDALLNDLVAGNSVDDYEGGFDGGYEGGYERVVRKPQRLRWGRSVPFEAAESDDGEVDDGGVEVANERQLGAQSLLHALMGKEQLRTMLLNLRKYDPEVLNEINEDVSTNENDEEFQREVRKPAPLRLRWGRSTGGSGSIAAAGGAEAQQKKSLGDKTINAEKSQERQTQNKN